MSKIVDYQLVQEKMTGSFLAKVKRLMQEGWEPQGGVSVTSNWYYQAMVMYEPEAPHRPIPNLPIIDNPPVTLDRGN